jgi:serine/threonine protein kinase
MSAADLLVLAPDVHIFPVQYLPETVRDRIPSAADGFAITRTKTRSNSKILDADGAQLLRQFRKPSTIVEAVLRFSDAKGQKPEEVLEGAFPLFRRMVAAHFLVRPDGPWSSPIAPSLASGSKLGEYQVVQVVQVLEDTEIYRVRDPAGGISILKLVTSPVSSWPYLALSNEALVLEHLAGPPAPRLFNAVTGQPRPYLVMELCPGPDAESVAAALRRPWVGSARERLADICLKIVIAYSALHFRGVVHGDVHPRNLMIDPNGNIVRLIDFGFARRVDVLPARVPPLRGGLTQFFEPEYARAVLSGSALPDATAHSEQYAVAALLYRLLTGRHCHDVSLEHVDFLQRVAGESPAPFTAHHVTAWPPVEAVLQRALANKPTDRFASMEEFGAALTAATQSRPTASGHQKARHSSLALDVLGRLTTASQEHLVAQPTASVNYGAAGIAYLLYRAACLLGRYEWLASAELWVRSALKSSHNDGYYSEELGITENNVGRTALYHGPPGVHAVDALVALAMGNDRTAQLAAQRFVSMGRSAAPLADLVTGDGGLLLGCALLCDAYQPREPIRGELMQYGHSLYRRMWTASADLHSEQKGTPGYLGIAHGLAGMLYATLQWTRATGEPLPDPAMAELAHLESLAQRQSGRVWWARTTDSNEIWSGWCHGTAGHVLLWTLAFDITHEERFLDLAIGAGEDCWARPSPQTGHLCCGAAGPAYAMLSLFRHTGAGLWMDRARDLYVRSASFVGTPTMRPLSLYKGDLGVCALELDLAYPEEAAMPLFESEGWPRYPSTEWTDRP